MCQAEQWAFECTVQRHYKSIELVSVEDIETKRDHCSEEIVALY